MTSLIAWLDASTDEQRRMREIIKLFSQRDSRDELGLGSIRDGLSDALFPGTSVLLTRARYLLFVPWCYELAQGKRNSSESAKRFQKDLIEGLKNSGDDFAGLIGVRAGEGLQTLPSTIYWTALRRFGILVDPDALDNATGSRSSPSDLGQDAGPVRPWSTTLPDVPVGFPHTIPGGFRLEQNEAGWLHDRIIESAPGTLLAHLVDDAPSSSSQAPWLDQAALRSSGRARLLLEQARLFSTVIHGAQLLYNLLLAEDAEALGLENARGHAERFRSRLTEWAAATQSDGATTWVQNDLWNALAIQSVRVPAGTRRFVDDWMTIIGQTPGLDVATSPAARALVGARERVNKGGQARLGNPRRLAEWRGGSGDGQLMFRWNTVRRIATDIHEGLLTDA